MVGDPTAITGSTGGTGIGPKVGPGMSGPSPWNGSASSTWATPHPPGHL